MKIVFLDATQEELAIAERLAAKTVEGFFLFLKSVDSSTPEICPECGVKNGHSGSCSRNPLRRATG